MRIEGDRPTPPSDLTNEGELRGLDSFGKDETPSPNLRGLEKFTKPAEPTEREAEDVGEIALEDSVEASKNVLRGLEKFPSRGAPGESTSHEVAVGDKVIHRDSGLTFEIEGISEQRNGQLVHLVVRDEEGNKIRQENLRPESLKRKLEDPSGSWAWA